MIFFLRVYVFLSCNEAQKTHSGKTKPTQRWCGRCPKCLFVFICLFPFLGEKKVSEIFGKNLLKDKTLLPLKQQLLGEKGIKPFECVGTAKETRAALTGKGIEGILSSWNNRNFLSPDLTSLLKKRARTDSGFALGEAQSRLELPTSRAAAARSGPIELLRS